MEDTEVIQVFVGASARQAFGPTLHIEGDALMLSGWWFAAFRVSHDAFMVRNEEPPEPTTLLDDLARELADAGLQRVGEDFPLMQPITYTSQYSVVGLSWALWAPDLAAGRRALEQKAGAESFLSEINPGDTGTQTDISVELEGARRMAGLPQQVILTVGLDLPLVQPLQVGLIECRIESRSLGEIAPEACSTVGPTLVVVDATSQEGREFIMELRAAACGRFLPVVAVSRGSEIPLGADTALDPDEDPATWVAPIRSLLPL